MATRHDIDAYERATAPMTSAEMESDEEAKLADMDTFTDWLYRYVPRVRNACADRFHHAHITHSDLTAEDADYIDSLDPLRLMSLILQQPWSAHHAAFRLQALYLAYRADE